MYNLLTKADKLEVNKEYLSGLVRGISESYLNDLIVKMVCKDYIKINIYKQQFINNLTNMIDSSDGHIKSMFSHYDKIFNEDVLWDYCLNLLKNNNYHYIKYPTSNNKFINYIYSKFKFNGIVLYNPTYKVSLISKIKKSI